MRANESLAGEELAKYLLDEFARMESDRKAADIERGWTDSLDFCYLNGQDPAQSPGNQRGEYAEKVFDVTAPWALDQAAGGLHASLTSLTDRWFHLQFDEYLMEDEDVLAWLQDTENRLYHCYRNPRSNVHVAWHEAFQSDIGLGNSAIFSDYSTQHGALSKRTMQMADIFWDVDYLGFVDTVARRAHWTSRQAQQIFGDVLPRQIATEPDKSKKFCFIHFVFPRSDRDPNKINKSNKPYASYWVCKQFPSILDKGGYDSFPYQCTRWSTRADDIYGRGPAQGVMPMIKCLNQICKTRLKAAFLAVQPPVIATHDGFMGPFNVNPRKYIWKLRGTEDPKYLESRSIFQPTDQEIERAQFAILRSFFNDLLKMEKERTEMTAFEVWDRRNEKLRQMGSLIGRQISEKMDPMIRRDLSLLDSHGLLLPPPPQLRGKRLGISYVSAASRAQESERVARANQFIQMSTPLANIDPSVLDWVNFDGFMNMTARILGVDREVVNSRSAVAAIKDQRAKQQQAQMMLEAAPAMGKTIKDIATAQAVSKQAA